jgi:hypothetical protein
VAAESHGISTIDGLLGEGDVGTVSRYGCVDVQNAADFAVTAACEAAGVSTSGYYDWLERRGRPGGRQVAEAELVELMQEIFDASDGTRGAAHVEGAAGPGW